MLVIALAIVIAQACWLEAAYAPVDCAAIAHVLVNRADGGDVAAMAHAYSLDKPTPRAAFARQLPQGLPVQELPRFNALVAIATRVLQGTLANPCPRARHWGSPVLKPDLERAERAIAQGRWRVIQCRRPTANRFYGATTKRQFRVRRPGD
jgi:hypothetical protein